jgi:DNA-binding response OmpR family regulator
VDNPKTILICDDDPLLVDLLEYRLASRGYAVTVAEDGGKALRRLQEMKPDAILLDAMMPVIDGYEVLRKIRENPETAKIPVIMLTARKQEQDIVMALELGANDYLVKPFIPEELVARLGRLLEASAR